MARQAQNASLCLKLVNPLCELWDVCMKCWNRSSIIVLSSPPGLRVIRGTWWLGSTRSSSGAAGHRAAPRAGAAGAPVFIDGNLYLVGELGTKHFLWSVVS